MSVFSQKFNQVLENRRLQNTQKPYNQAQAVAAEIYEYFHKKLSYPRIIGIVSRKGPQAVRECFQEIQKGDAKNKLALFIWKTNRMTVRWKD
jgi:hypothetical protein